MKSKELDQYIERFRERFTLNNHILWEKFLPEIKKIDIPAPRDEEGNLLPPTIGITAKAPIFKMICSPDSENIDDLLLIAWLIDGAPELIESYLAQKEELTQLRKKLEESQKHLNALATALNTAVSVFESKES